MGSLCGERMGEWVRLKVSVASITVIKKQPTHFYQLENRGLLVIWGQPTYRVNITLPNGRAVGFL